MTKEHIEKILVEYGVAFTDSLADRLLKEFEAEIKENYDCEIKQEKVVTYDETH